MSTTLPVTGTAGALDNAATTVGQQKVNLAALRSFLADLFGTDTADLATVYTAFKLLDPEMVANLSLTFSVAGNALTINAKTRAGATASATDPILVSQRSATAGNGDFNLRKVTAALSLTVSSGSTLGLGNSDSTPVYVYLIDNAGTLELALSKYWFGPSGIVSTTAEGGAGAADSGTVMYSTTARSNVPFRAVAKLAIPQTTAGTYTAVPTACQLWPFDAPSSVGAAYQPLSAAVGSSALTATLAAGAVLDFSVAGVATSVTVSSPLTVIASSGSTLGTSSGVKSRIWVVALYNSGTPELALINCQNGAIGITALNIHETIGTTAEGGAGAADSAGVFYSTTSRSNQAMVVVGFIESTQTTAGTWATAPSKTQGYGRGIPLPGTVLQEQHCEVAGSSTASTTATDVTSATVTITPSNAVNVLQCDATCKVGVPNTASFNTAAYIQMADGSNTTLDGETQHSAFTGGGNSGWAGQSAFSKRVAPGSASAYTFKLRHRASGAGGAETISTTNCKLHAREIMV